MKIASAGDALREILAAVGVQPSLRVPLADAIGHVLAQDVVAAIALPPWTNAAMDGYAARAVDVRGATRALPRRLIVSDAIAAGASTDRVLQPGEAVRIYTGARVPVGADSVIRQEDTDGGVGAVMVHDARDAAMNVRPAGGDLARGTVAVTTGTAVEPRHVAVMAALGVANPMVYRRPRVAILSTGDEVVPLDHPEDILAGRRLADVNGPAIAALVTQAGGIAVPLGIAPDDAAELQRIVATAGDADLLITAGGASVGDHDHVRSVMAACGVVTRFDRVRVRPGGPTVFGLWPDGRIWLALPGNPVSAMVTFELFGRPAIRAMSGHRQAARSTVPLTLRDAVPRDPVLEQYLRCTLTWPANERHPVATLTGAQGSGMLMSMVRADCLAIVPAGDGPLPAGSVVQALCFDHVLPVLTF
ncbi:MAG: molybdopterin molybdotransferase MoeA [Gemmatimonadales bacterium]